MSREITGLDKFVFAQDNGLSMVNTDERAIINNFLEEKKVKTVYKNVTCYEEAKDIVKEVMEGNRVVLQLDNLCKDDLGKVTARRILDYVGGAMFALNKKVSKVANLTFILNDK